MKRLNLSRDEARLVLQVEGVFTLTRNLTRPEGRTRPEHLQIKYPVGGTFWVAEPMYCAKDTETGQRYELYTAGPRMPNVNQYTLDRPATRIHFGEHRFEVEVIGASVGYYRFNSDKFEAVVTFRKTVKIAV